MVLDIHPPTKPIHSVRDFLLHLFTITCGILIALGLENAVEMTHHRHVAREAKANLVREVTANRNSLIEALKNIAGTQEQLESILQSVRALEADRSAKHGPLSLTVSISALRTTAWSTAATTGAVGYMKGADVERFTGVYGLQQEFMSAQQRAIESLVELESWGELMNAPLTRVSDAQGIEAELATGRALAATRMAKDLGEALQRAYRELLDAK